MANVSSTYLYQKGGFCVAYSIAFVSKSLHVVVDDKRGEWEAHGHSVCLFVKLTLKAEKD